MPSLPCTTTPNHTSRRCGSADGVTWDDRIEGPQSSARLAWIPLQRESSMVGLSPCQASQKHTHVAVRSNHVSYPLEDITLRLLRLFQSGALFQTASSLTLALEKPLQCVTASVRVRIPSVHRVCDYRSFRRWLLYLMAKTRSALHQDASAHDEPAHNELRYVELHPIRSADFSHIHSLYIARFRLTRCGRSPTCNTFLH